MCIPSNFTDEAILLQRRFPLKTVKVSLFYYFFKMIIDLNLSGLTIILMCVLIMSRARFRVNPHPIVA